MRRTTMKSKQQPVSTKYQPSGSGNGVMTRLEAVVTDVKFVLGGVHAMVKIGTSAPMMVRFTIEQALAADIIEEVE
jgi:hypothetical protein